MFCLGCVEQTADGQHPLSLSLLPDGKLPLSLSLSLSRARSLSL